MERLTPIETYKAWFMPVTDDTEPPTYHVYLSRKYASFYAATVVPSNTDSPCPKNESGFWHRASQSGIDALRIDVNEELIKLNGSREIHICAKRFLAKLDD